MIILIVVFGILLTFVALATILWLTHAVIQTTQANVFSIAETSHKDVRRREALLLSLLRRHDRLVGAYVESAMSNFNNIQRAQPHLKSQQLAGQAAAMQTALAALAKAREDTRTVNVGTASPGASPDSSSSSSPTASLLGMLDLGLTQDQQSDMLASVRQDIEGSGLELTDTDKALEEAERELTANEM